MYTIAIGQTNATGGQFNSPLCIYACAHFARELRTFELENFNGRTTQIGFAMPL